MLSAGSKAVDEIANTALQYLDSMQQDAHRQNSDFFAQAAASLRVHHEQVSACMSTLVQTPVATRRATKDKALPYSGCCVEFCIFENSSLGVVLGEHKLDILRLTTDFHNCSDDELQSELREQVKLTPGVNIWGVYPLCRMVDLATHVAPRSGPRICRNPAQGQNAVQKDPPQLHQIGWHRH